MLFVEHTSDAMDVQPVMQIHAAVFCVVQHAFVEAFLYKSSGHVHGLLVLPERRCCALVCCFQPGVA